MTTDTTSQVELSCSRIKQTQATQASDLVGQEVENRLKLYQVNMLGMQAAN